jgi:hypothetical protein
MGLVAERARVAGSRKLALGSFITLAALLGGPRDANRVRSPSLFLSLADVTALSRSYQAAAARVS